MMCPELVTTVPLLRGIWLLPCRARAFWEASCCACFAARTLRRLRAQSESSRKSRGFFCSV